MCSTRSELACSNMTPSTEDATLCMFWSIGRITTMTLFSYACNSSTFSSHCCYCAHNAVICNCSLCTSVVLTFFYSNGICFITFLISVIFASTVVSSHPFFLRLLVIHYGFPILGDLVHSLSTHLFFFLYPFCSLSG